MPLGPKDVWIIFRANYAEYLKVRSQAHKMHGVTYIHGTNSPPGRHDHLRIRIGAYTLYSPNSQPRHFLLSARVPQLSNYLQIGRGQGARTDCACIRR